MLIYNVLVIGLMALPRSPLHDTSEAEEKEPEDIIDAASLPPS